MAGGGEDNDETNDGSGWPFDEDEDLEDDEEEKFEPDIGPKKFLFCIPWEPLHYFHAGFMTLVTIVGLANGFWWTIRGF